MSPKKRYRGHFARRPPRKTMGADSNTDDLVSYATALGLSVAIIEDRDGCPEFLVGGWGLMRLREGKAPKGKLSERQEAWRKWWRGPPPSEWRTRADVDATVREMREESERRRAEAFEASALSEEDLSDQYGPDEALAIANGDGK